MIDGIDLHHYMLTGTWEKKGQATVFTEAEWAELMQQATGFDELITRHAAIMDRYDPKKRVWLVVGEWGTWHQVEPGTNPGFLYQQNTLRDALVASVSFDAFNKHADRVKMANIAQTVNVLQAMILTQKQQMLLTPTYHVFEFYTVHHDAVLLPIALDAGRLCPRRADDARGQRDGVARHQRAHPRDADQRRSEPATDHQRLGAGPVGHGRLGPHPHGGPDERAQHVRAARGGASGAVHRRNRRRRDAHGAAAREVSRGAGAAVTALTSERDTVHRPQWRILPMSLVDDLVSNLVERNTIRLNGTFTITLVDGGVSLKGQVFSTVRDQKKNKDLVNIKAPIAADVKVGTIVIPLPQIR